MTRWKITLEYKGSSYSGWQRQEDVPTIQGALEEALYKFCQQKITIYGAGRTDAGVHACGQVAHFDLDYQTRKGEKRALTGFELAKALNAHLRPQPISVLKAEEVDSEFHARFGAKTKRYHYRILQRSAFLALDQDLALLVQRPLNIKAMNEAAQYLIGRHDFTSFRDTQCQAKSPVKTLDHLEVMAKDYDRCGGLEIIIVAQGRSFLHHQVRNIAGTLLLVGEEKLSPLDVRDILAAKDRTKAGPTAPAQGLYMMHIDYDE